MGDLPIRLAIQQQQPPLLPLVKLIPLLVAFPFNKVTVFNAWREQVSEVIHHRPHVEVT